MTEVIRARLGRIVVTVRVFNARHQEPLSFLDSAS